jgi:S-adenosylmethionine:tRNA ribosyltransferase-isomerase
LTSEHSHSLEQFDYALPDDLIAQQPIEPRDAARLLVLDRMCDTLQDRIFRDLPDYLRPGDMLVANDTRVLPARLLTRRSTGGSVEVLLLERLGTGSWKAMTRPARRLRPGEALRVIDQNGELSADSVEFVERADAVAIVRFDDEEAITRHGRVPLPPYIRESLSDPERYQTVYAAHAGSAAAPTAGLHFTPGLLDACRAAGATFETVTLHVGLDTFQPIKVADVREHPMHSEWFRIEAPERIRAVKDRGGRIIAVGTTAVRTLESAASQILDPNTHGPMQGTTRLFITPGYRFLVVDALITNFHLPRTTLMLLVSAFASIEQIQRAYRHAVRERYRFYSFGDAMLIV